MPSKAAYPDGDAHYGVPSNISAPGGFILPLVSQAQPPLRQFGTEFCFAWYVLERSFEPVLTRGGPVADLPLRVLHLLKRRRKHHMVLSCKISCNLTPLSLCMSPSVYPCCSRTNLEDILTE